MSISFKDQVVIVTGAGGGLGKSHALMYAARGARVVVNDLGASVDGASAGSEAAQQVVAEIRAAGGEAISNGANVANYDEVCDMIDQAKAEWGRVDVLVNNAGILRDKSFGKSSLNDFKLVLDVHLMGSVNCTKAVWDTMKDQQYGRILFTTSGSGLYGNFGQANYSAAKMAMVGLMNTLAIEGGKDNIRVNCLAPTAGTRMTEGLLPEEAFEKLKPETVTPAVLFLTSKDAPSREIICAGAGAFAAAHIYETQGIVLPADQHTPEAIAENWQAIANAEGEVAVGSAAEQTMKLLGKVMEAGV